VFVAWHSKRRSRNLTIAFSILLVANLVYSHSPAYRLFQPNGEDFSNANARLVAWRSGLRMIEKNPIGGVGLGMFKPLMKHYFPGRDPGISSMGHNAYLEIAAEDGIPALVVFLALLVSTYRRLDRCRRISGVPPLIQQSALGLQAGLVGGSVAIFFLWGEYLKFLWLTIFLAMCVPRLVMASRNVGPPAQASMPENQNCPAVVVVSSHANVRTVGNGS
jgi:O-antigen ligase